MIIPVWGMDYVERWLALSFASMRCEGNIPYVNAHCDFELAIVTKSADAARMRGDARFNEMMRGLRVKFLSMDEFFPPRDQVNYGIPLTLAYAKGIADLGEAGIGSFVILMNADFILSAGSLKSLVARIRQGFTIVTAPSIRVVDAEARPILLDHVDKRAGVFDMSSREMMGIVNSHLHNTVRARTVNEQSYIDSTYYHTIYWRISPDCLISRYFLLMPLCFRVDRRMDRVLCPVDYGFITEICPEGRFTVLRDSDDFLMLELQERDSQAYLLRLAPKTATMEDRLALLEREIAAQTSGWATSEHRRSATQTLYFHEKDLPADIGARVAPFEAFMDRVFARMAPTVSHVRHFHWLGQVLDYRQRMMRGGADGAVTLLEDPRNEIKPTIEELSTPSIWAGGPTRRLIRYIIEVVLVRSAGFRGWARRISRPVGSGSPRNGIVAKANRRLLALEQRMRGRLLVRKPRRELAELLAPQLIGGSSKICVVYLFDTENYAPSPPLGTVIQRFPMPYVPLDQGGFHLTLDKDCAAATGTLLVYAPLNFLPHWIHIAEDVGRILRQRDQAILVLMQPSLEPARMADFAWLLSFMLGLFGSATFNIALDRFPERTTPDPLRILVPMMMPHAWLALPRRLLRKLGALLRQGLSYRTTNPEVGPVSFSALVIRMTPRP